MPVNTQKKFSSTVWEMRARARPSQREKTAFRNKVQHIKACGELVCIADEE